MPLKRAALVLCLLAALGTRPAAAPAADTTAQARSSRRAVVSGQSITGMVAAAILARRGYQVTAFEKRGAYTRNIQWAGRQALVDMLASIDPALADRFQREVARPIVQGSVHIKPSGETETWPQEKPLKGDATRVPLSGEEMMQKPSAMQMEARVFEDVLMSHLRAQPNVTVVNGEMPVPTGPDGRGRYSVPGYGIPDLVVVSEGSASKTRDAIGIESAPASPPRRQIAGVVFVEGGGVMVKHARVEGGENLLTGTMAREGSGKTWVVADVATTVDFDSNAGESRRRKEEYFRRVAAEAIGLTPEKAATVRLAGTADKADGPGVFTLQQRISRRASAGSNVVLFGDAVGNAHWSVGGGMQTGAVAHGRRLDVLLGEIARGVPRDQALERYSHGALEDTVAWGRRGIADFYMASSRDVASDVYIKAVKSYLAGEAASPLEVLDRNLPREKSAAPVEPARPASAGCRGVAARFLKE